MLNDQIDRPPSSVVLIDTGRTIGNDEQTEVWNALQGSIKSYHEKVPTQLQNKSPGWVSLGGGRDSWLEFHIFGHGVSLFVDVKVVAFGRQREDLGYERQLIHPVGR